MSRAGDLACVSFGFSVASQEAVDGTNGGLMIPRGVV
jgi:phage head maturation protease